MSYVSLRFILFIIGLFLIYYIFKKKYRWIVLLIGNLVFFWLFSGYATIYIILATLVTFIMAKVVDNSDKHKKALFILSIFLALAFLIVLKYCNFLIDCFNPLTGIFNFKIPYAKLLVPIGISYYTLEMISYLTDVYHGKIKAEKNYFKLLTFFSYFPKIVEGPISKYSVTGKKMFEPLSFNYDYFRDSLVLAGYGFIKKLVIADRLGIFVDNVFKESHPGVFIIVAVILYTLQIYFDFSGCIDIVRGTSQLFGIELPVNFKRPFFSTSIQEFWRRWHVTLGEWLKEYIFFPISLSKINKKINIAVRKIKFKHISQFIIVAFPLFFVWITNGIWHGAGIKYIVYGMYYYVLMMLGVLFKPILDKLTCLLRINTNAWSFKLFKIVRTMIIVTIGMFIFRCDSLDQFFVFFKEMFSIKLVAKLDTFGLVSADFVLAAIYIMVIFCLEIASEHGINVIEKLNEQNLVFKWLVYLVLIFSILIFGIYGRGYEAKSFIYGGF